MIPGAIAFAVDFYTGAIYLPPGYAANETQMPSSDAPLVTVYEDPRSLTPRRLAEVVRQQTGRDIQLVPGEYRAARIDSIDQLAAIAERLAARDAPGADAVIFRCQSD